MVELLILFICYFLIYFTCPCFLVVHVWVTLANLTSFLSKNFQLLPLHVLKPRLCWIWKIEQPKRCQCTMCTDKAFSRAEKQLAQSGLQLRRKLLSLPRPTHSPYTATLGADASLRLHCYLLQHSGRRSWPGPGTMLSDSTPQTLQGPT